MSPRTPQKANISGIHIGRVIQEQNSSEGLKQPSLLSLQCCSGRKNSHILFLIRPAVAGWYHPNPALQSRVYVFRPGPGCVHHRRFTSGEERPLGLSEEPKWDNPYFPLIASAAPRAYTTTLPFTTEESVSITCSVTFFPKKTSPLYS